MSKPKFKPKLEQRVAYMALKDIFKGSYSELRNKKSIKRHIRENQSYVGVVTLLKEHSLEEIAECVKVLLREEIFASPTKAKLRFPELFHEDSTQGVGQNASSVGEEQHASQAIEQIASTSEVGDDTTAVYSQTDESSQTDLEINEFTDTEHEDVLEATLDQTLFPVYLPMSSQLHVLTRVQAILEGVCFAFGSKEMPEVLEKEGWDCAECVELNRWSSLLLQYFEGTAQMGIGRSWKDFFLSIASIRHTAVHRLRVTAEQLMQYLSDAEILATLLEDRAAARLLVRIQQEAKLVVEELERSKKLLLARYCATIAVIKAQRAELDRLEGAALSEMIKNETECRALSGAHLEKALASVKIVNDKQPSTGAKINTGGDEGSSEHEIGSWSE